MKAPLPSNEIARLKTLYECKILDTPPEKAFDDITQLAASVCHTPIAWISLIERDRQWFKSLLGWEASEISRDLDWRGADLSEPELRTEMMLWSFAHGYATLRLSEQFRPPDGTDQPFDVLEVMPHFTYRPQPQ